MIQIVIEIEHLKGEKKLDLDTDYEFVIDAHLVTGESSCDHEKAISTLIARALKKSQDQIMVKAVTLFESKKDEENLSGNGHKGNSRSGRNGEIVH